MVEATLDFRDVEIAKRMQQAIVGRPGDGISVIKRQGAKLTLTGEPEILTGWVQCMKMRGVLRGLVVATMFAAITSGKRV